MTDKAFRTQENNIMEIGFIGLGKMGGAMASRAYSIRQLDLFVPALSNI